MRKLSLPNLERTPLEDGMAWLPVRRTLGVTGFSVNGYAAAAAGDTVIETHDQTGSGAGGHEELYMVSAGRAAFRALQGRGAEAVEHLRAAIADDSRMAAWARDDSDFDGVRKEPGFPR